MKKYKKYNKKYKGLRKKEISQPISLLLLKAIWLIQVSFYLFNSSKQASGHCLLWYFGTILWISCAFQIKL